MSHVSALAVSAHCYCGAVGLHSESAPKSVVHCHCAQCRRLSGAAFTTWASLPKPAVSLFGSEQLVTFNATVHVTRHFCKVCGSHVFTTDKRYPQVLGVPAGVIEGQLSTAPEAHYFVNHKAAWHTILDGLPQFGGESGREPTAV